MNNLIVEIDNRSGFCYGVIRAIETAETELNKDGILFSLGEIVHNNVEVDRLEKKGLTTIQHKDINTIVPKKMLIRAHGEPPETYKLAKNANIEIVDCTCPVVLKLQERIKLAYESTKEENGLIVIFGKRGHAEVNGLVGQTKGSAIVIENPEETDLLDFTRPIYLFSQTTKSIEEFEKINSIIKNKIEKTVGDTGKLKAYDTICRQVSNRKPHLEEFAKRHDVIIFVSGKQSSNGKVLYGTCKDTNPNSYFVEHPGELKTEWFKNHHSVGVCGATSTPKWLMEEIAEAIKKLTLL